MIDTSARALATPRKAEETGFRLPAKGKTKEEREKKWKHGNRPRMEFTARVGSIPSGLLLPRCWLTESGNRCLGGFISMSTSGSYCATTFHGVILLPVFRKLLDGAYARCNLDDDSSQVACRDDRARDHALLVYY